MSKKLFVLLIITLILVATTIITLTLTGHESMVRDAFSWLSGLTGALVLIILFFLITM